MSGSKLYTSMLNTLMSGTSQFLPVYRMMPQDKGDEIAILVIVYLSTNCNRLARKLSNTSQIFLWWRLPVLEDAGKEGCVGA